MLKDWQFWQLLQSGKNKGTRYIYKTLRHYYSHGNAEIILEGNGKKYIKGWNAVTIYFLANNSNNYCQQEVNSVFNSWKESSVSFIAVNFTYEKWAML